MDVMTYSPIESQKLASLLASHIPLGSVIVLEGPLGSGKTTFTQGIGRALGIKRAIKSPTYTIVRNYPVEEGEFVHIDAYRLEDSESDTVDIPMFLNPESFVVIEWAQFIQDELPETYYQLTFTPQDNPNERQITLEIINGTSAQQADLKSLLEQYERERRDNDE